MSSRDFYWYEDIVKEDFIKCHKINTMGGNINLKENDLKQEEALSINDNSLLKINGELIINEIWMLENCKVEGDMKVIDDFKSRNKTSYKGNLAALSIFSGHNFYLEGNLKAENRLELGNNSIIKGNLECKVLRVGENCKIEGNIKAEEVYAGSNFFSNGEIKCDRFMTGEHSKLMGKNEIGYFYSQNGNTVNGGHYKELHTDDNFKSTASITGDKLVMDNCVIVEGNLNAKDYIRVGDKSRIKGNLNCGGYFEFGPGTIVEGEKTTATEKQIPPSSAKIRTGGKVRFPEY